jgi:hypothetical protein
MIIVLEHVYQKIENIVGGCCKVRPPDQFGCVSLLAFSQDNNLTLALPHSLQGRPMGSQGSM